MPDNFYEIAMTIPVKTVSHPVKTEWGYHIIKVLDRKKSYSLEEVKKSIIAKLKQQYKKKYYENWRKQLFTRHRIDYHLDKLKKIKLAPKNRRA